MRPLVDTAMQLLPSKLSFHLIRRKDGRPKQRIISEYAEKGSCDAHYARGVGRVLLINSTGVHTLSVTVNGVAGNFILDSGATYVAVTPEFSAKAKIKIETANQL